MLPGANKLAAFSTAAIASAPERKFARRSRICRVLQLRPQNTRTNTLARRTTPTVCVTDFRRTTVSARRGLSRWADCSGSRAKALRRARVPEDLTTLWLGPRNEPLPSSTPTDCKKMKRDGGNGAREWAWVFHLMGYLATKCCAD